MVWFLLIILPGMRQTILAGLMERIAVRGCALVPEPASDMCEDIVGSLPRARLEADGVVIEACNRLQAIEYS